MVFLWHGQNGVLVPNPVVVGKDGETDSVMVHIMVVIIVLVTLRK
jgi:hypothetical protein